MSTLNVGLEILKRYPEENFFDANPPLPNLTPFSVSATMAADTPELLAACREVVEKSGYNPLAGSYGTNLLCHHVFGGDTEIHLPFKGYERPPPLPLATLPDDAVLLEQLSKRSKTWLFTVRVGDEVRLLKIFPDRPIFNWPNWRPPYDPDVEPSATYDPYEGEKEAYAHLLHYGACDKGAVPRCYGHLQLGRKRIEEISALPGVTFECEGIARYRTTPLDALLLEYFPGARQLKEELITETLADRAMRALYQVHASYVVHNDVHPRNILVLPDDRVVIVDFNRAICPCGKVTCRRQELLTELSRAWNMFYFQMLPNKRIGLVEPPPEGLTPTDEL